MLSGGLKSNKKAVGDCQGIYATVALLRLYHAMLAIVIHVHHRGVSCFSPFEICMVPSGKIKAGGQGDAFTLIPSHDPLGLVSEVHSLQGGNQSQ